MDLKAKLEKGTELKNAGNKAFTSNDLKGGKYHLLLSPCQLCTAYSFAECLALTSYHQAIFYLKGTDSIQQAMGGVSNEEVDPVKIQIKQVLGTCYSNMAACLLKEEKWARAIEYCKKALEADPKNKKAHFRIAQAYIRTGKLDLARDELQDLLQSDPDDAGVKRELALLKEKDKIETSKEKKIYKNMFERMAKKPDN